MSGPRPVRAPRGTTKTAHGWGQEAALRMLQNNLDPEVAEHPDKLVVYGGTGKAARNWDSFDALIKTLTNLKNDETMLVQSGKPSEYFKHMNGHHASSLPTPTLLEIGQPGQNFVDSKI